ncbi:hypothetical protein [Wenxinia marina]|uniref:Uncharacterized protein n=1 Tax=Wenxinia marina DSM 24838 TaxID=1123501 RepID=A0A0D0Q957_9RHOB|nr:hypothetical protein [Wenxinia marina]KIQ70959.1 hypothetical protein Wenmar_00335 [Wenxinia marina DSM 24838]GGL55975.1 hypothetical protein GCM10011392_08000 [Wenxinia marina]
MTDQQTQTPEIRTREFVRVEREQGTHPAIRALHRKAREQRRGAGVKEYARIERGQEA